MKGLFNLSNRDKKIYDLKQVEAYLDRVEGIKRDNQVQNIFNRAFV